MKPATISCNGLFSAPLWQSPFRPFYLFGVIYGLGVMALWTATTLGIVNFSPGLYSLSIWHGHEMVYGFAGAVVTGFVLTALPGWAGTREITGPRLALLLLLWFLGRIAVYSSGFIPTYAILILDSSLFPAVTLMVLPDLLRAKNKHYLALLPILIMLFAGNVIFYLAIMTGDMGLASWALLVGVFAIMIKFIIAGGFLTTVFTGNALRQKNRPALDHNPALEYLSALSLALFVYGALAPVPHWVAGGLAFIAAGVQLVRFVRWRTLLIIDAPLVLAMHLSYLWFIITMILFGAAAFTSRIGPEVWLHAFTVGALSMMMLALITRVALRHTGRSLIPSAAMLISFGIMFLAAVLRVMVALKLVPTTWLPATALIWGGAFLIYIIIHGRLLITASLPRTTGGNAAKGQAIEIRN